MFMIGKDRSESDGCCLLHHVTFRWPRRSQTHVGGHQESSSPAPTTSPSPPSTINIRNHVSPLQFDRRSGEAVRSHPGACPAHLYRRHAEAHKSRCLSHFDLHQPLPWHLGPQGHDRYPVVQEVQEHRWRGFGQALPVLHGRHNGCCDRSRRKGYCSGYAINTHIYANYCRKASANTNTVN